MDLCPCQSDKPYESCCGLFLSGEQLPQTAEQCLRSRYCAFARGEVDYIFGTHHPDTQKDLNRDEIRQWADESEWEGLEIRESHGGGEADDSGKIEFVARFKSKAGPQIHHEISEFKKVGDKWYFYDAEIVRDPIKREVPKVGRNALCHCGSGKKFKKCCGR